MESGNPLRHWLVIIVAILPILYLICIWNDVPDTVGLHFGSDGNPDHYGNKILMLRWAILGTTISIISYILVINVHRLDKKRTKGIKPPLFDTIAFALVIFVSIVSFATILSGIKPGSGMYAKVVMPAFGLFFIFMGNVMYNIKPNRFVGVRVPWTLNDDNNWKHTHRMSGKLFFVGGLLITVVSLVWDTTIATIFMFGVTLVIAFASILYSYLYYKNNKKADIQ